MRNGLDLTPRYGDSGSGQARPACVVSTVVIGVRLDATLREEIRAGEVAVPRARR